MQGPPLQGIALHPSQSSVAHPHTPSPAALSTLCQSPFPSFTAHFQCCVPLALRPPPILLNSPWLDHLSTTPCLTFLLLSGLHSPPHDGHLPFSLLPTPYFTDYFLFSPDFILHLSTQFLLAEVIQAGQENSS